MSNDASNDKPTSVQWAVRCLWISVGLVVLLSIAPFLGVTGIPRTWLLSRRTLSLFVFWPGWR